MKLIIAHLPADAFEPVRTELLDLGVLKTTVSQVYISDPLPAKTLRYRGAERAVELRPGLRLECFTSTDQTAAVVNVLRGHTDASAGLNEGVAVLDIGSFHHASSGSGDLFPNDPRVEPVVC